MKSWLWPLRLKVTEKAQVIQGMQKQIEELRRKGEQGSQQLQREAGGGGEGDEGGRRSPVFDAGQIQAAHELSCLQRPLAMNK